MTGILLTPYSGVILGPIARLLGMVMNFIFNIVPNVGVSIIIFTIVIYIALLPLTYKQQKFSKLSAKMNPELQAVQAKYKGKSDQLSVQKQNEEIQRVYKKYGVSPSGSCVQLLIQFPILLALYRVINNIPAYVDKIYECLEKLANAILSTTDGVSVLSSLSITEKGEYAKYVTNGNFSGSNAVQSVIDVLNKATISDWLKIEGIAGLDLDTLNSVRQQFDNYNSFLGLNVSYSPMNTIREGFSNGQWLIVIGAVMVPVLAALTQWLNTLFMPQPSGNTGDSSANMMKSMTMTMPLMSAFFCLSLPIGLGIYWIAGAVVRSIQQVVINKHINSMDLDSLIEANEEKLNQNQAKSPAAENTIKSNASISTRNYVSKASITGMSESEREEAVKAAVDYFSEKAEPGSIAYKAGMVKRYNERSGI